MSTSPASAPEHGRKKNVEHGISTRNRMVAVARRLFAESGFAGTSTEAVLRESGVSRGALYHHFSGKEALFEVVLDEVEASVAQRTAAAAAKATNRAEALELGMDAFLQLACDPEVRQIVLIDAITAAGWEKWREIDQRHGFGRTRAGLARLAENGDIPAEMTDVFSHLLLAAVFEAALLIARAPDPAVASRPVRAAFAEFLKRTLRQ